MGFLSTVPPDADDKLKAAVDAAEKNGGNFPALSEPAPTGVPTGAIQTDVNGVPSVKPTNVPKDNSASHANLWTWTGSAVSLLTFIAAVVL
jgi:phytepsin